MGLVPVVFLDLRGQIPPYSGLAAIRPLSPPDNLPVVAWAFPGRKGTQLSPCLCTVLALVRCREFKMSPTGRETGHEYVQVGRDGFVFLL